MFNALTNSSSLNVEGPDNLRHARARIPALQRRETCGVRVIAIRRAVLGSRQEGDVAGPPTTTSGERLQEEIQLTSSPARV